MKKNNLYIRACSVILFLILLGSMYSGLSKRIADNNGLSAFYANIVYGGIVGVSCLILIFRMCKDLQKKESNIKELNKKIFIGNIILFVLIIVNLMRVHIFTLLYYYVYKLTAGLVLKYWLYVFKIWNVNILFKIGLGIIISFILIAAFGGMIYAMSDAKIPVLFCIGALLFGCLALLGAGVEGAVSYSNNQDITYNEDNGSSFAAELASAALTGYVLDRAVESEVERQLAIQRDPMSEFRI